jgi:hypothetical protein
MKFRHWLQENEIDRTIEYRPDQPDPQQTTEFMPDGEKNIGIGTFRGFDQILNALRQIDSSIPNPEGFFQPEIRKANGSVDSQVFAGTPNFGAPEQWEPESGYHSLDNYERTLLTNIPRLFPELAQEAKELARRWSAFRNKVIQRAGVQENQQLRPIHYSLPLWQMQSTQRALANIGQAIQSNPDVKAQEIALDFEDVYQRHIELFKKVGPALKRWLKTSRNEPSNYKSPQTAPANVVEPVA